MIPADTNLHDRVSERIMRDGYHPRVRHASPNPSSVSALRSEAPVITPCASGSCLGGARRVRSQPKRAYPPRGSVDALQRSHAPHVLPSLPIPPQAPSSPDTTQVLPRTQPNYNLTRTIHPPTTLSTVDYKCSIRCRDHLLSLGDVRVTTRTGVDRYPHHNALCTYCCASGESSNGV